MTVILYGYTAKYAPAFTGGGTSLVASSPTPAASPTEPTPP